MKKDLYFIKDPFLFPRIRYQDKKFLPEYSGIYYVINIKTRNFIYIGKANNIRERWSNHHRTEDLELIINAFEEEIIFIAWELLPIKGLDKAEYRRIKALKPLLNYKNIEDSVKLIIQECVKTGQYCQPK